MSIFTFVLLALPLSGIGQKVANNTGGLKVQKARSDDAAKKSRSSSLLLEPSLTEDWDIKIADIEREFAEHDSNKKGYLEDVEFLKAAERLGLQTCEEDVQQMKDSGGGEGISLDALKTFAYRQEAMHAYNRVDTDRDGHITEREYADDVVRYFRSLGMVAENGETGGENGQSIGTGSIDEVVDAPEGGAQPIMGGDGDSPETYGEPKIGGGSIEGGVEAPEGGDEPIMGGDGDSADSKGGNGNSDPCDEDTGSPAGVEAPEGGDEPIMGGDGDSADSKGGNGNSDPCDEDTGSPAGE
eukprot:TRINITY_DN1535_c0_g1_i2.p1 TRINITY_DN1535_c0_g1~~TRINITY_DN1535_c0_g1_i2.p1  ORF type:complete len:298 (+),score=60.12 TRINITY_DN1535_c0_g1_i2:50-943(+)